MSLWNLVKSTGLLVKDTVDGAVDTALDVASGDVDSIADRVTNIPDRLVEFVDDARDD